MCCCKLQALIVCYATLRAHLLEDALVVFGEFSDSGGHLERVEVR